MSNTYDCSGGVAVVTVGRGLSSFFSSSLDWHRSAAVAAAVVVVVGGSAFDDGC